MGWSLESSRGDGVLPLEHESPASKACEVLYHHFLIMKKKGDRCELERGIQCMQLCLTHSHLMAWAHLKLLPGTKPNSCRKKTT